MIPSDLIYLLIIDHIILISREDAEEKERCQEHQIENFSNYIPKIFSFLGKSLTYQTTVDFISVRDFQMKWMSSVADANLLFLILERTVFILETVDNFITYMESLKTYFDNQILNNGLVGPNRISSSSALGIFVRKVSAKWNILMFQQQCHLFQRIKEFFQKSEQLTKYQCEQLSTEELKHYFLGKDGTNMTGTNQTYEANNLKFVKNYPKQSNLFHYVQTTTQLLQEKNFSDAEDMIHNYFDGILNSNFHVMLFSPESSSLNNVSGNKTQNPNNPEPETNLTSNNQIASPSLLYHIQKNVRELTQQEILNNYSVLKHQHSMISLAVLWIHVKNFNLAQSAIEEALKTAHQRGDHPTVIKCLLLLFEIYQKTTPTLSTNSNNNNSNSSSLISQSTNPEELLKRCLEKSGNLSLQDIFNESILKFLQFKISSISNTAESSSIDYSSTSTSTSASTTPAPDWNLSQLQNLLSFGMYNEPSLTLKYYSTKNVPHLEDVFASGNPLQPPLPQQQQQNKNNAAMIEKLPLNDKSFSQYAKLAFLFNELLQRFQPNTISTDACVEPGVSQSGISLNHLIFMNSFRLLLTYGKFYNYEVFSQLYFKFLQAFTSELFQNISEKDTTKRTEVISFLITIFKSSSELNTKLKNLENIKNTKDDFESDNNRNLEEDSNQISRISIPSSRYSALDCGLLLLLVLISLLKNEYEQSIIFLEQLLSMLDVPFQQARNYSSSLGYYSFTEENTDLMKSTFVNNILSFDETIRIYFFYKIILCHDQQLNFQVQLQYLQKLGEYYKISFLFSDAILVFLMNSHCKL
jgi:hypothetical protein